jgi:hypothetical protein
MENIITGKNTIDVFDELFAENHSIANDIVNLTCKKTDRFKLSSKVRYINELHSGNVVINDELADKKVYQIAYDLALAIDKNQPERVKYIKSLYGSTKEFAKAKDFLNNICKQVWDVYENKNVQMNVPKEAMKVLGISNKPALSILLDDSIEFFENDNSKNFAKVLSSVLNNPNLDYTAEDIFDYLKTNYIKKHSHYNFETIKFMAENMDNDLYKVGEITSDKEVMKKYFLSLSLSKKVKIIFSTMCKVAEEWITHKI